MTANFFFCVNFSFSFLRVTFTCIEKKWACLFLMWHYHILRVIRSRRVITLFSYFSPAVREYHAGLPSFSGSEEGDVVTTTFVNRRLFIAITWPHCDLDSNKLSSRMERWGGIRDIGVQKAFDNGLEEQEIATGGAAPLWVVPAIGGHRRTMQCYSFQP